MLSGLFKVRQADIVATVFAGIDTGEKCFAAIVDISDQLIYDTGEMFSCSVYL
jgi:hypothetical protein